MRKLVVSVLAGASFAAIPLSASAQVATLPACGLRPACNTPGPAGVRGTWRNLTTRALAALRLAPNHRARDLFMKHGGFGVLIAKFAYGPTDKDLEDEDVDVFIQAGCGARWYSGGTMRTTKGTTKLPALPAGAGVIEGAGGRVYYDLSRFKLPVGKHRIRFVVKGDGTFTDAFVEVLPPGAQIAVTDLDGTQTASEWAAAGQLVGIPVAAQANGPEALRALAQRGYYIYYLSPRPEWFLKMTHGWLTAKGYPPGLVRTTSTITGASGSKASAFKVAELKALKAGTGLVPYVGIGSKGSDVDAYKEAGLSMDRTYFLNFTGNAQGGKTIDGYDLLVPLVNRLPAACR